MSNTHGEWLDRIRKRSGKGMNNKNSITVDVNCNLCVSMETAECCMKLLELFLSANQQFRVHEDRDDNGKVMLSLFDLRTCEANL